jgi:hypothetical protein
MGRPTGYWILAIDERLKANDYEKSIICLSWKYLPQCDGGDGDASFGGGGR